MVSLYSNIISHLTAVTFDSYLDCQLTVTKEATMSQEGQDDPLHIDTPPPNTPPEPCQDSPETVNVEKETEESGIQDAAAENRDAGETEILAQGARPDERNGDALTNGAEEEERRKEEEQVKDDAGKNGETEHSSGGIIACGGCDDPLPQLEDSAEPQHTVRLVI